MIDFVKSREGRVGKREIARAFNVRGDDRIALKHLLRDLEVSGDIGRERRRLTSTDALPEVTILEISGTDVDGELLAVPMRWTADTPPPKIYVAPDRGGRRALRTGDRVLARLKRQSRSVYEAHVMRRIGYRTSSVLGIYRKTAKDGRIEPTDRRHKAEYLVGRGDDAGASPGELVLAEVLPGRRLGLPQARVIERLGDVRNPRAFSLIAIHSHAIPDKFSDEALALADRARNPPLGKRTDVRKLLLVTIDGADARDFDDAVWAAPDRSPDNAGGWSVTVAIADVANYVRPGDALDIAAFDRGNSVYFPDRVVPMLPEALSNNLCSLRPNEDRACLAVHLTISKDGRLKSHRFERALMRSAARLTYEQVQKARDGKPDSKTAPLYDPVILPLYGAYGALAMARRKRGALEIDLPERRAVLDSSGKVTRIEAAPRFDSHRLIEEFMIAANVAAAETLERLAQPCMYRIHDEPDPAKVEALRDFLKGLHLTLAAGQVMQARLFNKLLGQAAATPQAEVIAELVLRCQSQAVYSPRNIGHFGLALRRYAHFTSPIRRYSDLLVHRALIHGLRLGAGGLPDGNGDDFVRIGEHISTTERRAIAAERDTFDRYVAAYLSERQGETFGGRISGVTRFGLFLRLDEVGADGLLPIRFLPHGPYRHDERAHALTARKDRRVYRIGDRVEVRVLESNPVTGATIFDLPEAPPGARKKRRKAG
ncbi:MAG: ribonuclease R [Alphaproteobacteria bacterium]|nr:ribonuclease R [Alphaproteobacteria bacterium]